MATFPPVLALAKQWAEDDDPALEAARNAWDQLDRLAITVLLVLTASVCVVSATMLLRSRPASLKRRLVSLAVLLGGCGFFCLVVARMGIVWLVADPVEAGGPLLGSGVWWGWLAWLAAATLIGSGSVVGAFIVVGEEKL